MKSRYRYWCIGIVTTITIFISHQTISLAGLRPTIVAKPPTIATQPSQATVIEQQIQQAQKHYENGNFNAAAQRWQQILKQSPTIDAQIRIHNYLAIVYQDLDQWSQAKSSIAKAQQRLQQFPDPLLKAQNLNIQATLALNLGQPDRAHELWQQTERQYRSMNDQFGIQLSQLNQAQALQNLGHYRQARNLLEALESSFKDRPNSQLKLKTLLSLGTTRQMLGQLDAAEATLAQGRTIAQQLAQTNLEAEILLQLAQLATIQQTENTQPFKSDLQLYQQAQALSRDPRIQTIALVKQFRIYLQSQQPQQAKSLLPQLTPYLKRSNTWAIQAIVNLTEQTLRYAPTDRQLQQTLKPWLDHAVKQANKLNAPRLQAHVLGSLGHWYEQQNQLSPALAATEAALQQATTINAPEILVPWQWQQARLRLQAGQRQAALDSYDQAIQNLNRLRQDLIAMQPDVQFSFRDQVEPIYREYVQLLLAELPNDVIRSTPNTAIPFAPNTAVPFASKAKSVQVRNLTAARNTISALQLAELQNYLREACTTYTTKSIDKIDPKAAVIYPIVLGDRLEVIVSEPGDTLLHYGVNFDRQAVTKLVNQLRSSLNPELSAESGLPAAQQFYDWLIRPLLPELHAQSTETLVFVLDDFLQQIPMSVLHDGKHYLIEDYNVVMTPGLELFQSHPTLSDSGHTLLAGLSEARQGFEALPAVAQEIEQINQITPSQTFLNQGFTQSNLRASLEAEPASIIHLATHGQFSSNPRNTFLLTWNDRINLHQLQTWLQQTTVKQSIKLLILSACQTAKGDDRATLGLAGVAVRSGIPTTIATLWTVQDKATADLMTNLHRYLKEDPVNPAAALRKAQLKHLYSKEYRHPFYWSGVILVGNWK